MKQSLYFSATRCFNQPAGALARAVCLMAALFVPVLSQSSFAQTSSPSRPSEPTSASPQDQVDVIRIDTTLVTVPVSISDKKNHYLSDLRREQFHIYENGKEQEIAFFAPVESPFMVALLLDISDSTQEQLKLIQDAAIAFIDQLRPNDQVIVIAFDSKIRLLAQPQMEPGTLREAIHELQSGNGTSLYALVEGTIQEFPNTIVGRKAMVVLTDGIDTTSPKPQFTFDSSLRQAAASDVIIYPVQIKNSAGLTESDPQLQLKLHFPGAATNPAVTATYERGREYLQELAAKTGGQVYLATDLRKLGKTFAEVADGLRHQYSLGYYPKSRAPTHEIREVKVTVDQAGVVVHARKSYVPGVKTTKATPAKP